MLKQILIPVAAFAITATSAAAFTGLDWSNLSIDLSDNQVSALEQADNIRQTADEEARAVLEAAGIDDAKMHEIRDAMHAAQETKHEAMKAALEANDYNAFMAAIVDSPLAESITSEADFEQFAAAHQLREDGDVAGAEALMAELGIEPPQKTGSRGGHHGFGPDNHIEPEDDTETDDIQ